MKDPAGESSEKDDELADGDRAGKDATTTTGDSREKSARDDGWRQAQRGSKPGDRYVRAYRPRGFQRREPG
jgi:hypothetical protein